MPGDALFGPGPYGVSTERNPTPNASANGRWVSASSADEDEIVNDLRNLFLVARDFKRARYDTWFRNYRLTHNRFGSQTNSNWMPAPRDSEIYPTLSALVAWMTDQQISTDFVPAVDPSSEAYKYSVKLCDDLTNILSTSWIVEDYDQDVKLGLWDAFQYGVGIYKNVWDNSLSDGYGNAVLRRVDPYAFYVDPHCTSMRDMEYCCEARRMSAAEIERRYPDAPRILGRTSGADLAGIDERPNLYADTGRNPAGPGMNPGSLPTSGTWPGSGNAVSRLAMPDRRNKLWDPLPGYVVYEFWLRENSEWEDDYQDIPPDDRPEFAESHVHDTWRVIVMCNGRILMNERASDLWSYAAHPYERYAFDDVGEFYGVALVDHLAYPQIYINRLLTAMQHNAELVGNPVLLEATNGGTSRIGIVNRPGARIPVSGPGGLAQNAPKWLEPPSMPAAVMELIQFWISRIENTSGLSAVQKGAMPNQRSAEQTISNIQEAVSVRIRSALNNLEACLRRCTLKLADLMVDNYNEPRVMAILGPDGQTTSLALTEQHFNVPGPQGATPLKFVLQVEAGSSTPTSRNARVSESKTLLALGAVDDQYVLETYGVRNPQKILERLYHKRQQGLVGQGPGQRQRSGRTS